MDMREMEEKWQKFWEEKGLFKAPDIPSKKYYVLEMFPYPSGRDLHMGHLKNYTIGDAVARLKKMEGYEILHPMGWDAFGLPAENAAIKHGINPKEWTYANIEGYRETLKMAGMSYDWDREIATCDPEYYRWTQWIFLKLYEMGLAYRGEEYVNYCPTCKTVLANEQVIDGKCERCKTPVIRKKLSQWFFKITDYAERLLNDLKKLKGKWPENVIKQQENWIGRSEGTRIRFRIEGSDDYLEVFTTRADTLFGVTFITIAPEHPILKKLIEDAPNRKEIEEYIEKATHKTDLERQAQKKKTGVFIHKYAIHPFTGEKIPIYVGDYVLYNYGTGVVMGVPAHDQRDWEFAKVYDLPIKPVIKPADESQDINRLVEEGAYEEYGIMFNSGQFDGLSSEEGIKAMQEKLKEMGMGGPDVNYRLKDWLISRQRYWGAPIPVVYCDKCGVVPVPEDQLPVRLPENVKNWKPEGRSPLADIPEFVNTTCPRCGGPARRETDTMDTFVDSSWYYLRFIDPHNDHEIVSTSKERAWMPVDQYIGGAEHATKHLIYARFIYKALHDAGVVAYDEPFDRLFTQGLVLKGYWWCAECQQSFFPREEYDPELYESIKEKFVEIYDIREENGRKVGRIKLDGKEYEVEWQVEMMSKSKGNIVPIRPFIKKFGSDVARIAILFAGPPEKNFEWTEAIVKGADRFIKRTLELYREIPETAEEHGHHSEREKELLRTLHRTIKGIREDLDDFQFNTVVAKLMELQNALYSFEDRESPVYREALEKFALLLAPFAPHTAEEIWHRLGHEDSVFENPYPVHDEKYLKVEEVEIPVQVNGKVRARIRVPAEASEEEVWEIARSNPVLKKWIEGKQIIKRIYRPARMLSIVVK